MSVDNENSLEPWPWAKDERLRRIAEEHRRRLPEMDRQFAESIKIIRGELPPRQRRNEGEQTG